jgi:hypothetical protein
MKVNRKDDADQWQEITQRQELTLEQETCIHERLFVPAKGGTYRGQPASRRWTFQQEDKNDPFSGTRFLCVSKGTCPFYDVLPPLRALAVRQYATKIQRIASGRESVYVRLVLHRDLPPSVEQRHFRDFCERSTIVSKIADWLGYVCREYWKSADT